MYCQLSRDESAESSKSHIPARYYVLRLLLGLRNRACSYGPDVLDKLKVMSNFDEVYDQAFKVISPMVFTEVKFASLIGAPWVVKAPIAKPRLRICDTSLSLSDFWSYLPAIFPSFFTSISTPTRNDNFCRIDTAQIQYTSIVNILIIDHWGRSPVILIFHKHLSQFQLPPPVS